MPTVRELRDALPPHVFELDTRRSLTYAAGSLAATGVPVALAWMFVPVSWSWAPIWALYAGVAGTAAFGLWIIAHECGHGAFSSNRLLQAVVGFVFHTALLVPYFSWQRSHAIHHARTNHVTKGESHVPVRVDRPSGRLALRRRSQLGANRYGGYNLALHLVLGWPIYLLTGAVPSDGGGKTNHFWPWRPFTNRLFPRRWAVRVAVSTVGVAVVIAALVAWAFVGGVGQVVALYGGPYLVVNAWLVVYTWLQHTDTDTPHYDDDEWSFVRGAFCTIDRPYGIADLLHHRIGTTHVVHHLFAGIPHYHAAEATEVLAASHPELYRYDPTSIPVALWRVARDCVAVAPTDDGWRYVSSDPAVRSMHG